jgi:hypothetical protein
MTAAEYVDDTTPPSPFPTRPPDRGEHPEAS